MAGVVFVFVRDAPPDHPFHRRRRETLRDALRGIRKVLGNPRLPYIALMAFVAYSAMATVLTLWAGPYLADVHGLGGIARGNVLLLPSIGSDRRAYVLRPPRPPARHPQMAGGRRRPDHGRGAAGPGSVGSPALWLAVTFLTLLGFVGSFEATDGAAPEAAYRMAFGFLSATLIVALVFYIRVGDAKPSRDPRDGSDPVL